MKSIFITISLLISLFPTNNHVTLQSIFSDPQLVEISATLRFDKCNNKAYIPVELPPSAKGWIYSITAIRKQEASAPKPHLLEQIQRLSKNHKVEAIADFIVLTGKMPTFNLYILNGKDEAESFFNCGSYKYIEKYIGTKSRSAYIENDRKETYYIGIESDNDLKNLRLKIEAVAVI